MLLYRSKSYFYALSMLGAFELKFSFYFTQNMLQISANHFLDTLSNLILFTQAAKPDLYQCLFLVLVEANPNHFCAELVANHTKEQIFPNLV